MKVVFDSALPFLLLLVGLTVLVNFKRCSDFLDRLDDQFFRTRIGKWIPRASRFRVLFFGVLLSLAGIVGVWELVSKWTGVGR